jgi:hypothetical protein
MKNTALLSVLIGLFFNYSLAQDWVAFTSSTPTQPNI